MSGLIGQPTRGPRALSVIEPWASMIVHGCKPVENRTMAPPRAAVGRWILIHASKAHPSEDDRQFAAQLAGLSVALGNSRRWREAEVTYGRGEIIGAARLVSWARLEPSSARATHPLIQPGADMVAAMLGLESWAQPYIGGTVCLRLDDPIRLAHPVPARGWPGWWSAGQDAQELLSEAPELQGVDLWIT